MRLLPFLFAGALFGAGLAISGMTNPARVIAFLDVAGVWDPSLVFVMGGALATYAVGSRLVLKRSKPVLCGTLPGKPSGAVDRRMVIGASMFGVGWGLAGFCPGPAVTSLGWPRVAVLWLVPAMWVGMWVARRFFNADR